MDEPILLVRCLFVTIIAYLRWIFLRKWTSVLTHSFFKIVLPPAWITSKVDGISTVFEFNTLQCFAQGFMVMAYGLFLAPTKWQWKICICFLSIVIWAHRIHPQYDFFFWRILKLRGHINKYICPPTILSLIIDEDACIQILTMWLCSSP